MSNDISVTNDTEDNVDLPQWLSDNVPTPRETGSIEYNVDTNKYIYVSPDFNVEVKSFDSTEEAYDYAQSTGEDFSFRGEFPDCETIFSGMLSSRVKTGKGKFSRMMISSTDNDKLESLKSHYTVFLQIAEHYNKNPHDFMSAYNFVKYHPAMWIKEFNPRNLENAKVSPTYHWSTENSDIWCEPLQDDHGVVRWALETGGHTPDYTERYHDMRLDVWNESIEGAYIELASKVNKFFFDDGTQRPNVEYEKSDLEIMLEERLKEIDGWNDEDSTDD